MKDASKAQNNFFFKIVRKIEWPISITLSSQKPAERNNKMFTLTCYVALDIPNNVTQCLEVGIHGLVLNAHNLQFLPLKVNKPCGNCGFFLFKRSNLRRFGGCFSDKIVCISPNILLIDLLVFCFIFWDFDLLTFCISKFE